MSGAATAGKGRDEATVYVAKFEEGAERGLVVGILNPGWRRSSCWPDSLAQVVDRLAKEIAFLQLQ